MFEFFFKYPWPVFTKGKLVLLGSWPVWVLLLFVLSVVRNGWALYGPAPDLDAVEAQLDARRAQRLSRDSRRGHHHRR